MNFSKLLSSRQSILRQAHLANLAFSYFTISRLADRAAKAGLSQRVRLRATSVGEETIPASLTALTGSQSVIEEHFSDEDVLQLADSMEFALEGPFVEVEFTLDDSVSYVSGHRSGRSLGVRQLIAHRGEYLIGTNTRRVIEEMCRHDHLINRHTLKESRQFPFHRLV